MQNQNRNTLEHSIFKSLTIVEKELLLSDMKSGHALPKEYLYKDDTRLMHIYFIQKGAVLVGKNLKESNEISLHLFMRPFFLGLESIFYAEKTYQFAKTVSETSYIKISKQLFSKLINNNVQFQETIRNQLLQNFRSLESKYLLFHSKVEFIDRLKYFLEKLYNENLLTSKSSNKIVIHMTHFEISKFLYCSRQSVSHNLSKLKAAGIIYYERNYFIINDIQKLRSWEL
jgi:CRP-like cAMP-binding protein